MVAPTYKSLAQLIQAAESFIDEVDIVSFDVFDTLFVRRIADPDLIKIPVARFIAEKANTLGIEISWLEVATLRENLENEQRQTNGQNYPDFEANYDDFMPKVLDQVFAEKLPVDYFSVVCDFEIKLENAVLVAREELVDWVISLKQRGKRLFLISDIYLPAQYIERFVIDKGLQDYFESVISSADSFNAKASGTAFPLVQQRFDLDRSRWLHVGDNPISDGTRPQEFGIRALVIDDALERQRKALAAKYNHFSTHSTFWKGRNLQQLMLPLEGENTEKDDMFVQGFNQFGYLFGYFMQRLAEQCKARNLKRIYFCSREGWMLKQCWDRFAPWFFPQGEIPTASYLYVSRIALARAMISNTGLSQREVEVALLPVGNKTFADVCRIFGLDAEKFKPYLEKKDLTIDEVISQSEKGAKDASRRKLGLLLMDSEFQALSKRLAEPYRDAFIAYLDDEKFFQHRDVALVDIGWLGTIHNNFFNAVSHLDNTPKIHGYLMCATRYIDYPNSPSSYFEGLVYDGFKFDMAGSLLEYIKDIIEEICRAPHTSLIGYDPQSDSGQTGEKAYALNFRDTDDASAQAERDQSEYYAPLQQGILKAVEAYSSAYAVLGYSSSEIKPWLNFNLHRYIAFPQSEDIRRIQLRAHQDDFGKRDTANLKNVLAEKGLWQRSAVALKWIPGIRTRAFKKHCILKMKHS